MTPNARNVGTISEVRNNSVFIVMMDNGEEIVASVSSATARMMFRIASDDRVIVRLSNSENKTNSIIDHHRDDLTVSEVFKIKRRGTAVFFSIDPIPYWPISTQSVNIVKPNGETITAQGNVELARKVPPGEVMALLFPTLRVDEIPVGSLIYRIE